MRAIILCAGQGERCRPVTLFRPKPLIPVRGLPLVEHQLRYLKSHGIDDITLITGYLAEQFDYLKDAYNVRLRCSSSYATTNNHTSVLLAADLLDDCLILDGDLFYVKDWLPLLTPEISQFLVQPAGLVPEWTVGTKTLPTGLKRLVGVTKWTREGYVMAGVSYWKGESAKKLVEELHNAVREEYWEDAAVRAAHVSDIYCTFSDTFTLEIDSLQQARSQDLLHDDDIASLCSPAQKPVKLKGLTNSTYLVFNGGLHVVRIPGKGTEKFIDRDMEVAIMGIIADEGVTPTTRFYPEGFKLCAYLPEHRISTSADMGKAYFKSLATILAKLHAHFWNEMRGVTPVYIAQELSAYQARLAPGQKTFFDAAEVETLARWAKKFDEGPCVLCHRDLLLENIMVRGENGNEMQLIDFEYAGFTHPLWDVASFILEAEIVGDLRRCFFSVAEPHEKESDLVKMEILVDYIWGIWGYVNGYTDYAIRRLKRAKEAFEKTT